MSSNIVNQVPFLRTSRNFPQDSQPLAVEINKSYVDIANSVNARVIGIFSENKPSLTGESWFLNSGRQQSFRQIYPFTAAGNIAHGINTSAISRFIRIYGMFTDGTSWYPLPYVDAAAANNQVSVKVTSTNIVITAGGGSPPSITSGVAVLEWLSNV